jgi:hypothetical protein
MKRKGSEMESKDENRKMYAKYQSVKLDHWASLRTIQTISFYGCRKTKQFPMGLVEGCSKAKQLPLITSFSICTFPWNAFRIQFFQQLFWAKRAYQRCSCFLYHFLE